VKHKGLKSFLKGVIIVFGLAIGIEAFAIYGLPALGLEISDVVTYVSDILDGITNGSTVEAASSPNHKLSNGPMEGQGTLQNSTNLDNPENTGEEYEFDTTTYPYRAILSENEQSVYNQIYANALNYNTDSFTLVNSLSEDELCDTMNAVFNDHPELFWLNTSYKYGYNQSGQVVQVKLSYGISEENLETAKTAFDTVVASIVEGANAYSTEIEKELYIHDAICELCTYDTDADLNQSAYSCLVSGSTVCAGYARSFQVVCQEAGLTCYYLTGTADGGDHAWNIVYIDGNFYNVDVTWDDSISESYGSSVYTYFNLTDSAISSDHTRSTLSSYLPACTSTDMSYTNVYGSTVEIDNITNNGGGQLTDGNFTIEEPKEPIMDWKQESAPGSAEPVHAEPGNGDPGQAGPGQNFNQGF